MVLGKITEVEIKEKIRKAVAKNGADKETENKIFNEIMNFEYKKYYYKQNIDTITITFKNNGTKCIQIIFNRGTYNSYTIDMYCYNDTCLKCKNRELLKTEENKIFDKQSNCNHIDHQFSTTFSKYVNYQIVCNGCNKSLKQLYVSTLLEALEKNNVDIQKIFKTIIND